MSRLRSRNSANGEYECRSCGSLDTTFRTPTSTLICRDCGVENKFSPADIKNRKKRRRRNRQKKQKDLSGLSRSEKIMALTHLPSRADPNTTACGVPKSGKFSGMTVVDSEVKVDCEKCKINK